MGKIFLLFLIIMSGAAGIFPATYYVDAVSGNDGNSGFSPSSAWKTVAKVNSKNFIPGDWVLFKSGQKWREQLNIPTSGVPGSPILFGAYDNGAKPVISGAVVVTAFVQHTGNIWKRSTSRPGQVFFNEIRGRGMASLAAVDSSGEWFYDGSNGVLYIYSAGNPASLYNTPGIEAAIRQSCIYISKKYIKIENLQLEKTTNSAVKITADASDVLMDNLIFYQWTDERNWEGDGDSFPAIGGLDIYGARCEIRNSTFGKNTGHDIEDQNWAGFVGIHSSATGTKIMNNYFYHTSVENEERMGNKAFAIRLSSVGGITEVAHNYFYHQGSHAILVRAGTVLGDTIRIHDNVMEYPGQAGISCYMTRKEDGIGGTGFIYNNEVSFANRLGGDLGGAGNQSASIHMNDGTVARANPAKPYMKWYVYNNKLYNARALKKPNGLDSDGIGIDFNANEVEVFRNLIYNNWGKGIYLWNANRCKVYYNIIYGNDAGTTVTAASRTIETADNNLILNNTYYKNYNTDAYGPNYSTEIYFGGNGKNNIIKNNIFYGDVNGTIYTFRDVNTYGCITDNNIIYKDGGNFAYITESKYYMPTFKEWRDTYPQWDANSVYADPQFVSSETGNFNLKSTSPAANKGTQLGFAADFYGNSLIGIPDIGAIELQDITPPGINSVTIINANTIKIVYSEKVSVSEAQTPANYSISNGVSIIASSLGGSQDEVTLTTTSHPVNQMYTLKVSNIRDLAGNAMPNQGNTYFYNYAINPSGRSVILLDAVNGTLSGDARLGSMTGMKNTRAVYFQGTNGGVTFNINIPKSGQWYVWARMYYMSSGGKNSFSLNMNSSQFILGDNDSKYNQWHWDGYAGNKISAGVLNAGVNTLRISGREPGLTLWVDQVVITDDPDYMPVDENAQFVNLLLNAMDGTFSGDARLGSMTGMKNTRAVYFQGTNGGVTFNINIPKSGQWYVWARMYYMSSGGKNSFNININSSQFILGDNDSKYNQWHWDGYAGNKISAGVLNAGVNTLRISGREPGLTLWVDQVVITNNPDYIPSDSQSVSTIILFSAVNGTLSGDARPGTMAGMKNNRAVYFQGTNGGVTFNVNIPYTKTWYAWARMYYMSSGGKNSFFLNMNTTQYILGDNDSKYNQWHWDGYTGAKINLGVLNAGNNTLRISGREPGLTLWVDEVVITDDPNYNPNNSIGKETGNEELAEETQVPKEFGLSSNYPNPFNPVTNFRFSIPEENNMQANRHVILKIYDVLGNEAAVLVNEVKQPGNYVIQFNGSGFASGVYFARLQMGEKQVTRKIMLLK